MCATPRESRRFLHTIDALERKTESYATWISKLNIYVTHCGAILSLQMRAVHRRLSVLASSPGPPTSPLWLKPGPSTNRSFGTNASDIVKIFELARNLQKRFVDAPIQYKAMSDKCVLW